MSVFSRHDQLGSWEWNIEGDRLTWSPEMYRIYDRAPVLGPLAIAHSQHCFTPESWSRLISLVEISLAKRIPYSCNVEFIRPNGEHRWAVFSGEPVLDSAGNVTGQRGTVQDFTDRRDAEEQLQLATFRFRRLIEASLDPLVTISPGGKIVDVNEACEEATGLSRLELIGSDFSECFTDPEAAHDTYGRIFAEGFVKDQELTMKHVSGRLMDVLYNASVYRDLQGNVLGAFAAARDITLRKKREREIIRLNAELEQRVLERTAELEAANKELESFSYSVSHDLRAPLRGIDGWSQALVEDYGDKIDDQGREYLAQVCYEAQRMGRLIDDLLQLSRWTRAEMRREKVDLSSLSRDILGSLRQQERQRQVEVTIAPGLLVTGDPVLLRQVLENLLGNAWKFTGKRATGTIEVGVMESSGDVKDASSGGPLQPPPLRPGTMVYFVRDNGAGFDMAHTTKLFGPFQRLHRLNEFPGTGVGLATVQRIIHRHGGHVWADAKKDAGATFLFTLSGNTTTNKVI